ncbi:MAG: 23S rRNA (guanosine(2251)-2'-O)-methyltransferase RlmB, partial [Holophagaceae bacterium]
HTLWISSTIWDRVTPFRKLAREARVVIHQEPPEALDRKSNGIRHQGMIGEGSEIAYVELTTFFPLMNAKKNQVLLVALDGIMDPQNLGAILRTCAAAGVDGVILPERRSASLTESAVRASAGTAGRVPIARVTNLGRALDDLKDAGAWIYGLSSGEETDSYLNEAFDRSLVLVIGSESEGLHKKISERCDRRLRIPMPGFTESLNASAAAAIALFRVLAVRTKSP